MRAKGIVGAKRRGKPWRTTKADPQALRRPDLVRRDFSVSRPNQLWVADLSYLRCWEGIVYSYDELGELYFQRRDEKNAERYRRRLVRQLERLGHSVIFKPLPEAA